MEITFTKGQYDKLIKLVYLGNWMINSIRSDDLVEQYEDMEQYIFFVKDAGLEKYIEYSPEHHKYFPTREFEEETDVEKYREEYNDESFWQELVYRLARRDFIRKYGAKAVEKMDWEGRMEKEHPFIEKYADEFEKNGIENLEIRK